MGQINPHSIRIRTLAEGSRDFHVRIAREIAAKVRIVAMQLSEFALREKAGKESVFAS